MGIKLTTPYSNYPVEHAVKHGKNFAPNTLPCTFLGSPCQQSFNAFFVWEKLLAPLKFARIIELGTALGNTSVYFKMFCINKGADFYTYDFAKKNQRSNTLAQKHVLIQDDYIMADVFKHSESISKLIRERGISVVFCDGGDKPHELRTFAPALKKGDIIACHDWGRAIKDEWVAKDIKKNKLKEIYKEERISLNTVTGIFIKE
jgi:cephalosporin hydroxylase